MTEADGSSSGGDDDTVTGALISVVAAFLYATGLCIQRAALTVKDDGVTPPAGCRGSCCKRHHNLNWTLGLVVYGVGGLFLGTVSLAYIPLSLTSSIFSSVLIFNAIVAAVWLKESVGTLDIICYVVIMSGITLSSVYVPKDPAKYTIDECAALFHEVGGIMFWVVTLGTLIFLQVLIWRVLEPKYEQEESGYRLATDRVYRTAMCAYPITLGIYEGLAYTMLKAGQDSFARIYAGHTEEMEHWLFWFGLGLCIPIAAVTIMWVRKSYERFPTTQIFPLELGALTVVSVNGGLIFYGEYKQASSADLVLIYAGVVLMIASMVTLAFAKSVVPLGRGPHHEPAKGGYHF